MAFFVIGLQKGARFSGQLLNVIIQNQSKFELPSTFEVKTALNVYIYYTLL